MAGHSHWANIAHKKSVIDAKRGKVWSKLSKAIIVAAKMGGPDPDSNLRLRYAINDAKAISMPKDNIERAIKKGSGEIDGSNYEEVLYEGIGPAGVAIMCDILTDNRNRTAPEIRKLFEVCGGKLGATGCAAWTFDRKGLILIAADKADEEALMDLALEAGADDVRREGEVFEVICEPDSYRGVCDALAAAEIETSSRELTWIPRDTIEVSGDDARNVLKLMERLDDHDDVQSVSANFDISDEVLAEISAGN
ncbi:YebC/PmpR family DNA-binding transcriptional regulator [Aeoliella sp. SH292]|uniref:YebC/PmpR family DNA-binding transcriptional regulator n=1 Tax=Aeoliella sp. SH292 TaxID=3454464 RepID=UPI003F97E086